MYLARLGHLPLSARYSLGRLVESMPRTTSQFDDLSALAKGNSPIRAYHGCRALCDLWLDWSDDQRATIAALVESFVAASLPTFDEPRRPYFEIYESLARHYLDWCELHGPGWEPDTLAAIAWWLADRVASEVIQSIDLDSGSAQELLQLHRASVVKLEGRSAFVASRLRAVGVSSAFRRHSSETTHGGPFVVALVSTLGQKVLKALKILKAPAIDRVLLSIFALDPGDESQPASLVLNSQRVDWAATLAPLLAEADPSVRQIIEERRHARNALENADHLRETLGSLLQVSKENRIRTLNNLGALARIGRLSGDVVWSVCRDRNSFLPMLCQFDDVEFCGFLELLLTLQRQDAVTWKRELPHLVVTWIEQLELSDEKLRCAVASTILSASSAASFSAVRRCAQLTVPPNVSAILANEHRMLSSVWGVLPTWAASRLRPLLANLS